MSMLAREVLLRRMVKFQNLRGELLRKVNLIRTVSLHVMPFPGMVLETNGEDDTSVDEDFKVLDVAYNIDTANIEIGMEPERIVVVSSEDILEYISSWETKDWKVQEL